MYNIIYVYKEIPWVPNLMTWGLKKKENSQNILLRFSLIFPWKGLIFSPTKLKYSINQISGIIGNTREQQRLINRLIKD